MKTDDMNIDDRIMDRNIAIILSMTPKEREKPATMIPLLFEGAFIKNCRGIKRKVMDEIYEGIKEKSPFIQALAEMYAETLSTLMEDNPEGNVSWAMTR